MHSRETCPSSPPCNVSLRLVGAVFSPLTIIAGGGAALWAIASLMRAIATYRDSHMLAMHLRLSLRYWDCWVRSQLRVESQDWRYKYCGAEERAVIQAFRVLQLERRKMSRLTTYSCSIRVRQVAGNPWLLMSTALCKHLRSVWRRG